MARLASRAIPMSTALIMTAAALISPTATVLSAEAAADPPSIPRRGDLTLGGRAGTVLVGLTIRPGQPGPADVLVHVVPLGSPEEERLDVELTINGVAVPLDRCGGTCRRGVAELAGGEAVRVTVAGEGGGTQEFALPQLPAPPGDALLEQATRRMRALETYRIEETLGPADPPLRSDYAVQAPDRLRLEMETGQHTVRVGDRMFTRRAADEDWEIRSVPMLEVPSHIWDHPGAVAVRVVGRDTVDGAPTDVITFMIQVAGSPIWYRLWVDEEGLVPRAEMRARGHFMDHRYHAFNEPVDIQAPVGRLAIVRDELLGDRPVPHGLAALMRLLLYGGTLVAAGGVAFLHLVAAPGLPGGPRLARRVVAGAALGLVAALAAVPVEVVIVGGDGVGGLVEPASWGQVIASGLGARTALAAGGFTVLMLGVMRWAESGGPVLAAAGALAAVAAHLATGHSTVVEPAALALVANLAHLVAAVVWVGGLALLPLVLQEPANPVGTATVTRFSTAAAAAVAMFAGAGAILGWQHTGGLDALGGTPYGWTLLTKIVLVAAVVVLAGYNHWRLVPAIRRGDHAAWQRLRWTIRVEAVGVGAVLMVTAGLVDLPLPGG